MMIEEYRLMHLIRQSRPFTNKFFDVRVKEKVKDNEGQIDFYRTKAMPTDELFLQVEHALLMENALSFTSYYKPETELAMQLALQDAFTLKDTYDSMNLANRVYYILEQVIHQDMLNEYYHIPKNAFMNARAYKKANMDKAHQEVDDMEASEHVQTKQKDIKTENGMQVMTSQRC